MDWFAIICNSNCLCMVLLNVLIDSTAATHSVKMIDEALTWSDTGLEVRLCYSQLSA